MKHCFECLKWIGCPPALIAIILVIHESPKACVRGTEAWFEVLRGIHQGCFLCLTLFGLLLDFLLHLADHGLLGVELTCENKRELSCPQDILEQDFKEEKFGYADHLAQVSTCLDNLSSALLKLDSFCSPIGLKLSVKKTEWLWLCPPSIL